MENKPSKQDLIEANNLLEEAQDVFENCIHCGKCKSLCPAFKVLKEESISPRGHAINLSQKILENALYQCTLCKVCEETCPMNIKICTAVRKGREALVLKGKTPISNIEL